MLKRLFGTLKEIALIELLKDTSLDDLYNISQMLGKGVLLKSRARLIAEIPGKLSNAQQIKKYILSIPDDERATLIATHFTQEYSPDLLYIIKRRASRTLNSLKNRGLIFYIPRRGQYIIPKEISEIIRANLDIKISKYRGEAGQKQKIETGFAILREAFTLISLARSKVLRTTKAGNIFSNSVDKITNLLEINSLSVPAELTSPEARVAFLLEYLKVQGLISVMGKNATATTDEDSKWIKERYIELLSSMVRFYFEEYCPPKSISEAITISLIIALLTKESELEVDNKQFIEQIKKISSAVEKDEDQRGIERVESTFVIFGLLRISNGNGTIDSIKPTDIGRGVLLGKPVETEVENNIYILPDFNVIASREIELSLRVVLETFLEITSLKETITYKLTRNSAYTGFKAGYSAEGIINILREFSSKPLPQNIEFSLINWYNQYKKVSFKKGIFLITESKEVADELLANKQLSKYIKDMYQGPSLLLSDGSYDEVIDILEKMGYMPKPIDEEPIFEGLTAEGDSSRNNIRMALEKCVHLGREVYLIYRHDETIWRGYAVPKGTIEKNGISYIKIRRKGTEHDSVVPLDKILYISFQD